MIGRDKTGVVARVTSFLFEQKANIEAIEEQVTRGQFSMTLQASWKDRQMDRAAVQSGLARLASSLRMEDQAPAHGPAATAADGDPGDARAALF